MVTPLSKETRLELELMTARVARALWQSEVAARDWILRMQQWLDRNEGKVTDKNVGD
jgi:hypothetical protein